MKFCFWGQIGHAFKGKTLGGGELQMALLAKSFAREGHEVVIVDPFSDESFITEEGIKVIHIPNWEKGLPGIKVIFKLFPALYRIFLREKADYYYVRMRSYIHLIPFLAAKKLRSKFIVHFASDADLLGFWNKYRLVYRKNFRIRKFFFQWIFNDFIYNYLLKRADYVVRQHEGQVVRPGTVRGKVVLFPNIIDLEMLPEKITPKEDYFIYVGSLSMLKGADKLFNLISTLNDNKTVMIVGQPNDRASKPIYKKLGQLANTNLKGRECHLEALKLMSGAKALINTSLFEGFPNVFLEAWALGIPVLSLHVNPGNILNTFELGYCFEGDIKKMSAYINSNKDLSINEMKTREYINKYHNFTSAGKRFLEKIDAI